ncbi:hypothetical protein GCM10010345_91790 [Streptomyces canarius]|uniref:Uncharacterized protein n=1 Tax=Streptomyces canarius TaxID=285453 RepID=A0ABQ3DCT6_9ACTN|nr:hypothetical protein GCM10010345_91790 [Streptomyces canarius]
MYAGVARLVALGTDVAHGVPGVTAGETDVGRWLKWLRDHVVYDSFTLSAATVFREGVSRA